ncbi:FMN-dependent NADH-azoreductase [Amycolatopsis benzoatilytica]|uniref:FMN-dependent NADH-azoreductase n=1 Tax=Amycolatopsis benzoatilytica TaxID=346045 RepID=UPI0003A96311|nr:NAD(P)H-dependent oxidoreductase [Amycolatopsis benzoatilytica]
MTGIVTALLRVDSSADRAASVSRQLGDLFARQWLAAGGTVHHRDVSAEPVAPLREAYARLGRRVERKGVLSLDDIETLIADEEEQREWHLTRPLITEVLNAHTVLLGVPMYNFGIPATLKAWIDRISFPGVFLEPGSGRKLLADKDFVVVLARGGGYRPGTPRESFEFQESYLRAYLADKGATRTTFVPAEFTRAGDVPALDGLEHLAADSKAAAVARLQTLARPRPRRAP